ncbi:MAG: GH1 family beta-glucosidase [Candidatus Sumerlaeota bacterium]
MLKFPEDFTWGVATSAYQIEGAAREDGKSMSTWDEFVQRPGKVQGGVTGDVACDSYHRYPEDIRCMEDLGVGAYRFSLSWPRVMPLGRGGLNPKGLDYYNKLIDSLLEKNIEPYITLYHWDLPLELEREGGWRKREMADLFAHYADQMLEQFGDRVKKWLTFNEIHAFVNQGYGGTSKAPGANLPEEEQVQIYHHVLLGHGKAVQAMRARYGDLQIGTAENPRTAVPIVETPENVAAALKAWDRRVGFLFGPMYEGKYPDNMLHTPYIQNGYMETINQELDLIGMNLYSGCYVEATDDDAGYRELPFPKDYPRNENETWITYLPEAMYWAVRLAKEKYGTKPLYIFENGYPLAGDLAPEEDFMDLNRINFIRNYLSMLHRGIEEGCPVKGYFLWSLMDSFEWISGFTSRFGIYHNDFETQERRPRKSVEWYREVVKQNALV